MRVFFQLAIGFGLVVLSNSFQTGTVSSGSVDFGKVSATTLTIHSLPRGGNTQKLATSSPLIGQRRRGRTALSTAAADDGDSAATSSKMDWDAIFKYISAVAVQMSLLYGILGILLDKGLVPLLGKPLPAVLNFVIFYAAALKSRFLNPLSNRRPLPKTKEIEKGEKDATPPRKMPEWTPPGFVFPIVWLLLIGPLRAVTSCMVVKETGMYASTAVMSLMLHLSIGDVWNTINNVERRYGTSILGVLGVYSSAALAARQYYNVLPKAGLLGLKLIWLTIASSLIIRTWQLNPNPETGKKYSLLPKTGEGSKTEWIWFQKG